MLKYYLIILFAVLFFGCPIVKSQGLSNLWLFGYGSYTSPGFGGTNIDFSSGIANVYAHSRPMNISGINACITNAQGNLLFYTNGIYIANSTDSVMANGDSLLPGPFEDDYRQYGSPIVQGGLIIPLPSSDSLYYLFHVQIDGWPTSALSTNLYLTIIDISLNSGKGGVISKSNSILADTLTRGQLTAIKHANGRDWWVIAHKNNSNLFYSLLVTPQGVNNVNSQQIGQVVSDDAQVTFSSDGSKFARYNGGEDLDIFNFDRCTGLFSNFTHININDSAFVGGVAFSSSSQYLYVFSSYYIYQFDVNAVNIDSTRITIANYDGFLSPFATLFFLCHLAPDGKIYGIAPNGVNVLHVIDYPDSSGFACNVIQHGVVLPTYNDISLPTPPNYFLGPVIGSNCDSLNGMDEHLNEIKNFTLKPNPNNGSFSISYLLPQNKSGVFEVFDMLGKMVYKKPLPHWSSVQNIHLPPLANGVYNAVLKSDYKRVCKKIVLMQN